MAIRKLPQLLVPLLIGLGLTVALLTFFSGGPTVFARAGEVISRWSQRASPLASAPLVQGTANLRVVSPAVPPQIGDVFTISVVAEQVNTPLSAFQFDLTYDPTILEYRYSATGPFLGASGREVICPLPAYANDTVRLACASTGKAAGVTGDGALAVFTFEARAIGTSALTLSAVQLLDAARPPAQFSVTAQDGQVAVSPPGGLIYLPIVVK